MIFGDPSTEQIVINENTIWCGPPLPPNNPKGPELINKMRNLIFNGKYEEAVIVCEKEFADGVHENARSYQPFGFLNIDFKDKGAISNSQTITASSYFPLKIRLRILLINSGPLGLFGGSGGPHQIVFSLITICSVEGSPKIIPPILPLPIGNADR